MKSDFGAAMRQALDLVRSQDVMEATRVIQRALLDRTGAQPTVEATEGPPRKAPPLLPSPPVADRVGRPADAPGSARVGEGRDPTRAATARTAAGAAEATRRRPTGRKRRPLGEVVALLGQANLPGLARGALGLRKQAPVAVPEGSAWLARSYASPAGARDTKVYVPSGAKGRALPLVVMLHGCTQDADDFAAGTAMNAVAEDLGFLVAYPQQPASANRSACWNWFERAHQTREAGEPAILAGVARAVVAEVDGGERGRAATGQQVGDGAGAGRTDAVVAEVEGGEAAVAAAFEVGAEARGADVAESYAVTYNSDACVPATARDIGHVKCFR